MIKSDIIVQQLKERIANFSASPTTEKVGVVLEVGDGIARVSGLREVASMEMLDFGNEVMGVALNLEHDSIGAIILGDFAKVKQGDTVRGTGKILAVPVGEALVGRVVDALGQPKDGRKTAKAISKSKISILWKKSLRALLPGNPFTSRSRPALRLLML
jgi:F-type H+/Na+-transporting ATPase subunit alpha